jgi:multiple sugar transport system ATP-binding protein
MNLFEGRLSETSFENGRFVLEVPTRGYEHRAITIGIRAEHLHLDADGGIRAEVVLVEPLLADKAQYVYAEMGSQRIAARLPAEQRVHVGDQITLSVDPSNVHFFDPKSGKRL